MPNQWITIAICFIFLRNLLQHIYFFFFFFPLFFVEDRRFFRFFIFMWFSRFFFFFFSRKKKKFFFIDTSLYYTRPEIVHRDPLREKIIFFLPVSQTFLRNLQYFQIFYRWSFSRIDKGSSEIFFFYRLQRFFVVVRAISLFKCVQGFFLSSNKI